MLNTEPTKKNTINMPRTKSENTKNEVRKLQVKLSRHYMFDNNRA